MNPGFNTPGNTTRAQFLTLPSGTVLNLALVRRIVPAENGGISITFGLDDIVALDRQDADFLSKRLPRITPAATAIKFAVFWIVIVGAVILVYLAIRTAGHP